MQKKPIRGAEEILKNHLDTIARVYKWAKLLGYNNTNNFSNLFVRHYRCRPSEMLKEIRLKSIIKMLRNTNKKCLKIAWKHSMADEKALYNFMTYHLELFPTEIRNLPQNKVNELLEEFL